MSHYHVTSLYNLVPSLKRSLLQFFIHSFVLVCDQKRGGDYGNNPNTCRHIQILELQQSASLNDLTQFCNQAYCVLVAFSDMTLQHISIE